MRESHLRCAVAVLSTLLAGASVAACSDSGASPSDSSIKDGTPKDGTTLDKGPTPDGPKPDGPKPDGPKPDGPTPDAFVAAQDIELCNDDGLPVIKLTGFGNSTSRMLYTPDAKLLPVLVRKIRILVPTAYTATVLLRADASGSPGKLLGQQSFTVAANEVGTFKEIDVSALKAVATGPFWVLVDYPPAISQTTGQQLVYGSSSGDGSGYYFRQGFSEINNSFNPMMRVVVGTAFNGGQKAGADGDACKSAVECASGFCPANKCSKSCSGNADCGAGRRCATLHLGKKACVKTCANNAACGSGAFCLPQDALTALFSDTAAKYCVKAGPRANGTSCQYHYHSICQSGNCAACANDALNCAAVGNCVP